MKKTLSIILSVVLILSTLTALIIPASAEGEGDWDVVLRPVASQTDDKNNPPTPGYYYDETGFHTTSPTGYRYHEGCIIGEVEFCPRFTVISKEPYDIENFSITVAIHDYQIEGDNWLSFSLWSDPRGPEQGDTSGKYGDGWTSLIRGDYNTGKVNRFESWDQTKGGRTGNQVFKGLDNTQLKPIVFDEIRNDEGDRVITFSIEGNVVKINGVAIGDETNNCIKNRFTDSLAYVSVTFWNSKIATDYHPTISVIDVNGEIPTGSDSREVHYCYDTDHIDENTDTFCDLCHKYICSKYGHIDDDRDLLCDICDEYDCESYGHVYSESNRCDKCGFYDCDKYGHYDAGGGYCYYCGAEINPEETTTTSTYCHHIDNNFDDICDLCGKIKNVGSDTSGGEETTPSEETTALPVETDDETEEDQTKEKTTKDDIYDDSDAPVITIAGCELSASLGIISIVSIIGAGILIKKKED